MHNYHEKVFYKRYDRNEWMERIEIEKSPYIFSLKWISENQERSMADNISWSNLPWPERLMLRPCICLQTTAKSYMQNYQAFLMNNNLQMAKIAAAKKYLGRDAIVFRSKWNCDDPRLVIHHISLLCRNFFLAALPFCYTDLLCMCKRWMEKNIGSQCFGSFFFLLSFANIHHPRLQVQKRHFL